MIRAFLEDLAALTAIALFWASMFVWVAILAHGGL